MRLLLTMRTAGAFGFTSPWSIVSTGAVGASGVRAGGRVSFAAGGVVVFGVAGGVAGARSRTGSAVLKRPAVCSTCVRPDPVAVDDGVCEACEAGTGGSVGRAACATEDGGGSIDGVDGPTGDGGGTAGRPDGVCIAVWAGVRPGAVTPGNVGSAGPEGIGWADAGARSVPDRITWALLYGPSTFL